MNSSLKFFENLAYFVVFSCIFMVGFLGGLVVGSLKFKADFLSSQPVRIEQPLIPRVPVPEMHSILIKEESR